MSSPIRTLTLCMTAMAVAATLVACGGGSDEPPAPPPPAAAQLDGTAAVGAALSRANVSITNRDGPVCQEATIVTSDTGAYSCTLQDGRTAPFIVVVTDPTGAVEPMVSIGTATPQPGTPLTVNVTPITTAIVAQLSPDRSALSAVASPASIDVAALDAVKANVLQQLSDVLTALGAANYDPFTTPITAATGSVSGNTADRVVDVLRFSTVNGVTLVTTVDNPTGAVPLADATAAQPAPVSAPGDGVATLSNSLRLASTALGNCFRLEVSQRVLATDATLPASQGGPMITQVAPECEDVVHDNYLHNGYLAGQQFYGLMNDANMTGAAFSLPDVLRYIEDASAADHDRAIVNIRYVDRNGNAGNIITIAQKVPGHPENAARGTEWWLVGNQQPIDSSIQPTIRRREQLAPNPGTAPFASATASRFESGINIFVNKDGPNSTGMRAVRVRGPGLPPAGLVYTRPDPALVLSQTWMNIRRKDGNTDPAAATPSASVGNIFILQRTAGISGSDATTVRAQPNAGNSNNTQFINWAHPLDYGVAPGTPDFIEFGALRAQSLYAFEVFYDGETTPRYSFNKSLQQPVVPATRAAALQWVDLASATRAYLDPAHALAASQTSITLNWTANPYAETIASAGVYTGVGANPVNQGLVGVARGATTATANAPVSQGVTVPFPALANDGSSYRQIQLRYRTLNGSYKDSFTQFN
jgi:hypothetical protein